ncbi:MAG: hypothetical protein JSS76_00375 [Bacteroidetes bacterium]|nr:hypothetical protein [Bacteroidota bacterium]
MRANHSINIYIILCLTAVTIGSCKKDKPTTAKPITGGWLKAGTTEEFYIATADHKWYIAGKDNDGFKTIAAYNYEYSGTQLKLQGMSDLKLYNTRFSGDTFILNDGNIDYLKLVPSNTAPASVDQWVSMPKVLISFADTAGVKALTTDAGHLYGLKTYSGSPYYSKLFDFDPSQQRVVHEVVTDMTYDGLDFLDGTLWTCSSKKLYKLNVTTGINTYASADNAAPGYTYALAAKSDGIYTYTYNSIQVFDPNTPGWTSNSHSFINYVDDLAYANGYLLFTHTGLLYRSHPYYLLPGDTWYVEGYNLTSIAYDGTYYWAGAQNLATQKHEILKLQLD